MAPPITPIAFSLLPIYLIPFILLLPLADNHLPPSIATQHPLKTTAISLLGADYDPFGLGLVQLVFSAEFFGYLQARWEELAQYEPLNNLPTEAASLVTKRLV